jgi:hypothetical protein
MRYALSEMPSTAPIDCIAGARRLVWVKKIPDVGTTVTFST